MADTLLQPEFCAHDTGEVVFQGDSGPLCGACHAPMLWIARSRVTNMAEVWLRVTNLARAEEAALRSPMSRQERACRKATRDAYRLVLDLMDEMRTE